MSAAVCPPDKGGASQASGGLAFSELRKDRVANALEVPHHVAVGESYDSNTPRVQRDGTRAVLAVGAVDVVAVAVESDDEQLPGTVKVGDVAAERLLAGEFLRQAGDEFVPELSLRGRLLASQVANSLREADAVGDVSRAHGSITRAKRIGLLKLQTPRSLRSLPPFQGGKTKA